MIRKFFARVLDGLDLLYSFEGSQSRVDQLDLGPLVLVHDVSREAEFASSIQVQTFLNLTTDGAGTLNSGQLTVETIMSTSTIRAALEQRGLEVSDVNVWLTSWNAFILTTQVGNLGFLSTMLAQNMANGFMSKPLNRWDQAGALSGAAGVITFVASSTADNYGQQGYGSLLMAPGSFFRAYAQDDAGGILSCTFSYGLELRVRGVPPR